MQSYAYEQRRSAARSNLSRFPLQHGDMRPAWLALLLLAGCATPLPPPGPVATGLVVTIDDNGWHTDICLRAEDADPWLIGLARDFDNPRFLCFGFGLQRFMVEHDHSLFTVLSAALPSRAAIAMTPLPATPEAMFGADNVVHLGISRTGANGLAAFIRASIRADADGTPKNLGDGPAPGRIFYAAAASYDGLNTCNTWTGTALRSAGIPVEDGALFASDVMRQVRPIAAAQANDAAKK